MPTISEFEGITVRIYTETNAKHHTPHIHAISNNTEASVALTGEVLAGKISEEKLRILRKWLIKRQIELTIAWAKAIAGERVTKIAPLRKGE